MIILDFVWEIDKVVVLVDVHMRNCDYAIGKGLLVK